MVVPRVVDNSELIVEATVLPSDNSISGFSVVVPLVLPTSVDWSSDLGVVEPLVLLPIGLSVLTIGLGVVVSAFVDMIVLDLTGGDVVVNICLSVVIGLAYLSVVDAGLAFLSVVVVFFSVVVTSSTRCSSSLTSLVDCLSVVVSVFGLNACRSVDAIGLSVDIAGFCIFEGGGVVLPA